MTVEEEMNVSEQVEKAERDVRRYAERVERVETLLDRAKTTRDEAIVRMRGAGATLARVAAACGTNTPTHPAKPGKPRLTPMGVRDIIERAPASVIGSTPESADAVG